MKYLKLAPIFILITFLIGCNSETTAESLDKFAACLSEEGAEMYGASWCGHCSSQKEMFGDSFEKVSYVECPENQDKCREEGIQGYPTWKFEDETVLRGTQSFTVLAVKTGCALP